MAYRILREATDKAKIAGKVATHSMRKTFAERMYTKLDKDLLKLQKALGHRDVNSTIAYLSFNQQDIDDAILSD
jgi:integrase